MKDCNGFLGVWVVHDMQETINNVISDDSSYASSERPKRRKSSLKNVDPVVIDVTNCRYEVVREQSRLRKWTTYENEERPDNEIEDHCNIIWCDSGVTTERAVKLKRYQKINHFPGMFNLARKAPMGRNLSILANEFPLEYEFFPQTFVLPGSWNEFRTYVANGRGNRTFIIKPDAACQGRGIFLTRSADNVPQNEALVAQRYLHKPLLIEGYKFDMRIYVVVTNVDPLRVFLFRDGLIRLCTEKYIEPRGSNLQNSFMHLTNYAINKSNEGFVQNSEASSDGTGSKRSLKWFYNWIEELHGAQATQTLQDGITDIFCKALVAVNPLLKHSYKSSIKHSSTNDLNSCCFEILGFDIMVDQNLKPWLIETNHHPSLSCDSPLDLAIKSELIKATLSLINVSPSDKREDQMRLRLRSQNRLYSNKKDDSGEQKVAALSEKRYQCQIKREDKLLRQGIFKRIYPCDNPVISQKYSNFLSTAQQIFDNKTAKHPPVVEAIKKNIAPTNNAPSKPTNAPTKIGLQKKTYLPKKVETLPKKLNPPPKSSNQETKFEIHSSIKKQNIVFPDIN